MGRTVELGDLVTRCLTAADLESQTVISSATTKILVDRAYRQVYRELALPGVGYFDTEATITSTGVAAYALPADHLSTIGIEYVADSAGHRCPLRKLMRPERPLLKGNRGTSFAYDIVGTNIELFPTPPSAQQYIHVYIPQPADITEANDATLIEMATLDGEEMLIWLVVYYIRDKLDLDTRSAKASADEARIRVAEDAALRIFESMPRRVVEDDIHGESYDPGSFYWNRP